jgi:hypothetical protein
MPRRMCRFLQFAHVEATCMLALLLLPGGLLRGPSCVVIIIIIIIYLTPIELIAHKGVSNEAIYRRNPLEKKTCKPLPTYYFIYLKASCFVPNRRILTKDLKLLRFNSTRTVSYNKSGVDRRILRLLSPRFSNSTNYIRR